MTRSRRFTITGIMGAVVISALGMTAYRSGSESWAGALFLATCVVLTLAVVGAACRGGAERAWWLGFALFGWGYLVLISGTFNLPTDRLRAANLPRFVPYRFSVYGFCATAGGSLNLDPKPDLHAPVIHCLYALGAAAIGGQLARFLFGGRAAGRGDDDPATRRAIDASRRWWHRPAVVGPVGVVAVAGAALLGLRSAPGPTAAAALFATCGLFCLAAVGAACGRGTRRAACLGALLFGTVYMALIFGRSPVERDWPTEWPAVATNEFLNAAKSWLPHFVREYPTPSDPFARANARIQEALNRPVSLRFPGETPLQDFVTAIRAATRGPDGREIPIHVDPVGLQEADKTIASPVVIDLDGVPLRTALRLTLDQLGLGYTVFDGVLILTYRESAGEFVPPTQDPFLVVGQCLLGGLAALLGGWLSRFVVDRRGEPRPLA